MEKTRKKNPLVTRTSQNQEIDAVVLSGKSTVKTLESLKKFPFIRSVVVRTQGLGFARNLGVSKCNSDLVFMFDDDLIFGQNLMDLLLKVKPGEFAIAHNRDHYSTRVFAIHRSDYFNVGGFDSSIKYVFEDGDFVLRALKNGLKLKVVPSSLYFHVEHVPNRHKGGLAVFRLNKEYCRMLVKYKREVFSNLFMFFWYPKDYKIKLQDLVSKGFFMVFYIIKGVK